MTLGILMPFYGDQEQFKESVLSIIAQDDGDWHLTILNDCYPHWDPESWVAGLADPRITLLRNEKNLGVQGSFDRCIDLAAYEYSTIMGCDDRLLPGYVGTVKRLIADFDNPDYVQPGVAVINDHGDRALPLADRIKRIVQPSTTTPVVYSGESIVTSLMHGNWTYFPALCWRTEQLQRFRFAKEFEIVLDLAMQLDILIEGGRFAVSPELAFEYRRHEASASSYTANDGTRFIEERDFYRAASERLKKKHWNKAAAAARFRSTSRLNALSKLPQALLRGNWAACSLLIRHALGN